MVIKIGMIGLSDGNGHPFSYSAIVNGYSDKGLYNSEWRLIYDYVSKRDISDFGFEGVYVTDAWTQDINLTNQLCDACLIPNAHSNFKDMIGKVDAVIIARDDYDNHFEMAIPFLEAGHFVFIDKPLTLNTKQLIIFKHYIEKGQLMSCSGLRYAIELDDIRKNLEQLGELTQIQGIVPKSWGKYGVHLLEAIFNIIDSKPISITSLDTNHSTKIITLNDGKLINIINLNKTVNPIRLQFIGTEKILSYDIKDNFSMFKRTLWHFIQMIKTNKNSIPFATTSIIMHLLIAGQISTKEKRTVYLNEVMLKNEPNDKGVV